MSQKNDRDDRKSLADARRELSEVRGRPFEVDKAIAQYKSQQERERKETREATTKMEREHTLAREHRHALRAQEIEQVANKLEEEKTKFRLAEKRLLKESEKTQKTVEKKSRQVKEYVTHKGVDAGEDKKRR